MRKTESWDKKLTHRCLVGYEVEGHLDLLGLHSRLPPLVRPKQVLMSLNLVSHQASMGKLFVPRLGFPHGLGFLPVANHCVKSTRQKEEAVNRKKSFFVEGTSSKLKWRNNVTAFTYIWSYSFCAPLHLLLCRSFPYLKVNNITNSNFNLQISSVTLKVCRSDQRRW